jgi:hypothetical protein
LNRALKGRKKAVGGERWAGEIIWHLIFDIYHLAIGKRRGL